MDGRFDAAYFKLVTFCLEKGEEGVYLKVLQSLDNYCTHRP